jgi:hypothetical protein
MAFDLYVWKAPRSLEPEQAAAILETWHDLGGDPANAPFESSTDTGWFYRELKKDYPDIDAVSDGVPDAGKLPMWLSTDDAPPARLVAIRLTPATARDEIEEVFGLATKYDLVVFDPRTPRITRPMEALAAYASATFWPRGAIRGAVAGLIGLAVAVGAWIVGIPILSGILVLFGGFMFVLCVWTFIHQARKRWGAPGSGPQEPETD